jgi:hypothetical protein
MRDPWLGLSGVLGHRYALPPATPLCPSYHAVPQPFSLRSESQRFWSKESRREFVKSGRHPNVFAGNQEHASPDGRGGTGGRPADPHDGRALPPKNLFHLLQLQRQPLRLNCYGDNVDDNPDGIEAWFLADPRQESAAGAAAQVEMHVRIEEALRVLPDKQQQVIRLRFGLTGRSVHTLREVGRALSLTGERIRQLEHDALRRLRTAEAGRRLEEFLPGEAIGNAAADGAMGVCAGAY